MKDKTQIVVFLTLYFDILHMNQQRFQIFTITMAASMEHF